MGNTTTTQTEITKRDIRNTAMFNSSPRRYWKYNKKRQRKYTRKIQEIQQRIKVPQNATGNTTKTQAEITKKDTRNTATCKSSPKRYWKYNKNANGNKQEGYKKYSNK